MKTFAAAKLPIYAALAALGCLGGLALARPEPVLLGAPFLLALVIGVALPRTGKVDVQARSSSERAVEGDAVTLTYAVRADGPVAWLEVLPRAPRGLVIEEAPPGAIVDLKAGETREITRTLRCQRWGGYLVGEVFIRARDPLGFFVRQGWSRGRLPLRIFPEQEALRTLVPPGETQIFAGNERSRATGEGIEFADTRPFLPGDRVRRINWRLTSRLGELHVNDLHRERNTDVVIFLDTFAEVGREDVGTRFQAVRAAATLAEHYLQRRDRVGLISFGGILHWLTPAMGLRQRYRIVESLIETDIVFSYAWKRIAVVPPQVLPPKALVIALTPLLDERAIDALLDLSARRFDLAIVEISPMPFVARPKGESGELGFRIWQLDREVMRDRFRGLGVPVATWEDGQPLAQPLREVELFRRSAHLARA